MCKLFSLPNAIYNMFSIPQTLCMSGYGIILQLGSVQYSEHNERFVERLLRLLYWTTVHSERSLNGSKPQIGVFAVANKDAGAHRVFFIMQKYSISPKLWATMEEFEYISDT